MATIRVEDLPPKYREQVARQILARPRRQAAGQPAPAPKGNKYHNKPTERLTSSGRVLRFDSQKEARRYDELIMLQQAGQIKDLHLQQTFVLRPAYIAADGTTVRATTYKADFTYKRPRPIYDAAGQLLEIQEEEVVEDVKSTATRTEKYKIKKKMMMDQGHLIHEV